MAAAGLEVRRPAATSAGQANRNEFTANEAALAALREDTQQWWADLLARDPDEMEEGEEPATADVEGLCSARP